MWVCHLLDCIRILVPMLGHATPYNAHPFQTRMDADGGAPSHAASSYFSLVLRIAVASVATVLAVSTGLALVRSTGWSASTLVLDSQSDIGTCAMTTSNQPRDCERIDYGTCGASCCGAEVAVPNIDPLDAYQAIVRLLSNGGPDGRFYKKDNIDDEQGELPFSFSPPLPWRFTISGSHSTPGTWMSQGNWRSGFDDTLRFSIGVAADGQATRIRMFSMSGPASALVDYGQSYKNLALLCSDLGWPAPTPSFGCGLGQAVAWKPENTITVMLQNRDGVCLDAKERHKNGGVVQTWDCDPTNLNQLWKLDSDTGLVKNEDGVCLSDASAGNSPGPGPVVTWACDPTLKNQAWNYDPVTGQLKARHGTLCIDASDRHTNGGKVMAWPCDVNNSNQQWNLRKIST